MDDEFADARQKAVFAVVKIKTNKDGKPFGYGAGVLLSDRRSILTNLHVINEADAVRANFFGKSESTSITCKLVDKDRKNDLALLALDKPPPKKIVGLSLVDRYTPLPEKGARFLYVGHPLNRDWTVHETNVSNILTFDQNEFIQLQSDSATGFSGGPVVGVDGRIVGIIFASEDGFAMSYVIPHTAIRKLNDSLSPVAFDGTYFEITAPRELTGLARSDTSSRPLESEGRFIMKLKERSEYATITEGDFFNVEIYRSTRRKDGRFAEEFCFLTENGSNEVLNGSVVKVIATLNGNGRRVIAGIDREGNGITRIYTEGKDDGNFPPKPISEPNDPLRRLFVVTSPNRKKGEPICYGDVIVLRCKYRDVHLRIDDLRINDENEIVHSHLVVATSRIDSTENDSNAPNSLEDSIAEFQVLPLSAHPMPKKLSDK